MATKVVVVVIQSTKTFLFLKLIVIKLQLLTGDNIPDFHILSDFKVESYLVSK